MDGSSNGFNKAIVLIAVAISGIAAGQYLFRQGSPIAPQGPWGSNYLAQMPMAVYPPQAYPPPGTVPSGYPQPGYPQSGYPQASYGPNVYPPQGYGQPGMAPQTRSLPPMAHRGYTPDQVAEQTTTGDHIWPSRPTRVRSHSMPVQRIAHHTADEQSPDEYGDTSEPDPSPITKNGRAGHEIALASGITPMDVVTATRALAPAIAGGESVKPDIKIKIAKIQVENTVWSEDFIASFNLYDQPFSIYVQINNVGDTIPGNFTLSAGFDNCRTPIKFSDKLVAVLDAKNPVNGILKGDHLYGPLLFTPAQPLAKSINFNVALRLDDGSQISESPKVEFSIREIGGVPLNVSVASTQYADLVNCAQVGDIQIFDGFLWLKGTATPSSKISFVLLKKTGDLQEVIATDKIGSVSVATNGGWSKDITLPNWANSDEGKLIVTASVDGKFKIVQMTLKGRETNKFGVVKITPATVQGDCSKHGETFYAKKTSLTFNVATVGDATSAQMQLFIVGSEAPLTSADYHQTATSEKLSIPELIPGDYNLCLRVMQGKASIASSDSFKLSVRTSGPYPISVSPTNLAETPGSSVIRVRFNPENQLDQLQTPITKNFNLKNINNKKLTGIQPETADYVADDVVVLTFADIPEGAYKLSVRADTAPGSKSITGLNGNALKDGVFEFGIIKPIGSELSSTSSAGLRGSDARNVLYPEFTKPRDSMVGFNPSDKVVTKIARLYYFRDAHRVVQLVNRDAKSHNRQTVDVQQQLADKYRGQAEDATGERQVAERAAIQAASQARAAEQMLKQYQQGLIESRKQLTELDKTAVEQEGEQEKLEKDLDAAKEKTRLADEKVKSTQPTLPADQLALDNAKQDQAKIEEKLKKLVGKQKRTEADKGNAEDQVTAMEGHVSAAMAAVQTARNLEAEKRELSATLQFKEDRARADLFRREVAAAKEDPDTYAPGNPTSQDPMLQVSLSVIGEGLIQLRGPSKGVNLVRTLINQIDAPVGQVRIGIHSVQVNGEHGKRMEPVIGRIQLYVDHSRFLTVQSGQMLRNAVTLVASRCADQAMIECAEQGQAARDQKYIASFFGQEFLDELQTLDSEFLQTGNKLLSLHSMDSTSLANALFLLSLAKNDVRQQILTEFDRMVTTQLPLDEQEYFIASAEQYKFGPMFHKTKFQFLAHNAKFVSLKGFFNAEVAGAETLTPMQREFIRLAQIFKSRLVTELELQQRVMERSLIEDRLVKSADGSTAEANAVIDNEKKAQDLLKMQQQTLESSQFSVLSAVKAIEAKASAARKIAEQSIRIVDIYRKLADHEYDGSEIQVPHLRKPLKYLLDENETITISQDTLSEIQESLYDLERLIDDSDRQLNRFALSASDVENLARGSERIHAATHDLHELLECSKVPTAELKRQVKNIVVGISPYVSVGNQVYKTATEVRNETREVGLALSRPVPNIMDAYRRWTTVHGKLQFIIENSNSLEDEALLCRADESFQLLASASVNYGQQQRIAEASRRPLDHKKFLDMLIDDVEDKFIELMEGTRAHTANIDNYLSRLGQALDDDFQTQFYNPAFKGIREAGRYWDVQMGQIETTTVLTNNRMFAKVSPQATMEFDLPKRSILIQEAMKSGKAAYDDYGALLGDPTFLALTKMHGGQAASAVFNRDNSSPTVRSLLPGLPSTGSESLIAQSGAAAPDFPSALESLIPDPAIYKFETGTGYEIRPVIQPDGQAVVFHFSYMYTTNIREPVRADEKHLGRVKRHYIDTDVQTGNYELREVSRYQVALKASRTSRGVPFLEDLPGAGILFRPLPNQESSLQQNLILAQTVIFPTLYDLMGLRWAPVVADMDALRLQEADFVTRSRQRSIRERVFDYSSQQVDEFLRIPAAERRTDLYRSQETTPMEHPNGYQGRGMKIKDGTLREGYVPEATRPDSHFIPGTSAEGAVRPGRRADAGAFTNEAVLQESSPTSLPTSTSQLPEGAGLYESHPPQAEGGPSIYDEEYRDQTQGEDPSDPHRDINQPVMELPSPHLIPPNSNESPFVPPAPSLGNGQYRSLFKSPLNRVAKPSSNSAIQLQSYQSETRSGTATEEQKPPRKVETAPKKGTQPSGVNRPEGKPAGTKPWSFKRTAAKPATLQPTAAKSTAMKSAESNLPPAMLPGVTTRKPSSWRTLEGVSGASKGTTTARAGYSQVGEPSVTDPQTDSAAIKTLPGAPKRRDSHIVQVKGTEPEPASKTQKVRNPLLAWPKKP